jgi:tail tube protein
MADSDAHTGMGAHLQKGDGNSPENFVSVLGIKSITGPNMQRTTHDVTTMDSGTFREFIGGLVDAGEITFEANFLPRDTTQNQDAGGFMAEFDKSSCDSRGNWRITLPECAGESDGYWEFEGIVTGQQVQMPMDDLMSFSGTIKISGRPNLFIET